MIKPNESLSPATREIALEIYRQKHGVYFHLDALRWHVPSIAMAAGSLVLAFSRDPDGLPAWWSLVIAGLFCVHGAFAIWRIRIGIGKRNADFREIADMIGDHSVTPRTRRGATWVLQIILTGLGALAMVLGLLRAI